MMKKIVVLGLVLMGIVGMISVSQHSNVVKQHNNTVTFVNTLGNEETLTRIICRTARLIDVCKFITLFTLLFSLIVLQR